MRFSMVRAPTSLYRARMVKYYRIPESVNEALVILKRFTSFSTTRINKFDVSILPILEVANADSSSELNYTRMAQCHRILKSVYEAFGILDRFCVNFRWLSVTILVFACTTNNGATFHEFDIPEESKKAHMHVFNLRCEGFWELWHALCPTPTGMDIRRVCWGYEQWLLRRIFVVSMCLEAQVLFKITLAGLLLCKLLPVWDFDTGIWCWYDDGGAADWK